MIARGFGCVASGSRKKREYDDIEPVEEKEDTDCGDEDIDASEALDLEVSCGKRTAMVPPKVGRLVSPHIVIYRSDVEIGWEGEEIMNRRFY